MDRLLNSQLIILIKNHFVPLIGMGQIHNVPYLVMELVGRNLADIREQYPPKRFQPQTVYRISVQVGTEVRMLY